MMRGVNAISPELERLIEDLPQSALRPVVEVALHSIKEEYRADADISAAIEKCEQISVPNTVVAQQFAREARKCDQSYIAFEEQGKTPESQAMFRKMCIYNGLHGLMASDQITGKVVDNLVYDFGFGCSSIDAFAERMIKGLQAI